MREEGFTNKEILVEIKRDLKEFRDKYEEDSTRREAELSKRPTRAELWSLIGAAGVLIGIATTLAG